MNVEELNIAGLLAERMRETDEGLAWILSQAHDRESISFSGGFPEPETFPSAEALQRVFAKLSNDRGVALQYAPSKGINSTIEFVADWTADIYGRRPDHENVLITSGAIDGLNLACRVLLNPGDLVAVEGPTYLGALQVLNSAEAEVLCVQVDEDGLAVEELEDKLAGSEGIKFLYTIPDFQNPSGATMSESRRSELVQLARKRGFLIIEDVAYRELYYGPPPPPSLWAMAPDVVVQLGTFSKLFLPGVRLGWALGPELLIEKMILAKQTTDQCAGALGQRMVEIFGRSGEFDTQLERMRQFYRVRRDAMSEALRSEMTEGMAWTEPGGGFFVWGELETLDASDLLTRAGEGGPRVSFVPGRLFYPRKESEPEGARKLRLSFSRVSPGDIRNGVARLAESLRAPVP